jgi:hypothetical protein
MTIRKQGSATGRVLGVENADPEPALDKEQEPEDTLVDRPCQGTRPLRPAPDGDDD